MKIAEGDLPWHPSGMIDFETWHFYNHPLQGIMTDADGNPWFFCALEDDQANKDEGFVSRWAYIPVTSDEITMMELDEENTSWSYLPQFIGREVIIAEATDLRVTRWERRVLKEEDTESER